MTQADGRYLIVWTRPFRRDAPSAPLSVAPLGAAERVAQSAFRVVWGYELACYLNAGWFLVAEDPEPDRYAEWRKPEDDPA